MKAKQLLVMAAVCSAATVMADVVVPGFEVQQDGPFNYEMGERGVLAYGDYNNDGYLDCLMIRNGADPVLWKNNGDKTFTNVMDEQEDLAWANVYGAAALWTDFNNDGNLDLIISGCMSQNDLGTAILYAYTNEGAEGDYFLTENFKLEEDVFVSYARSSDDGTGNQIFYAADFNNDGYNDVLFCSGQAAGVDSPRKPILYVNDKNGSFVQNENPEFQPINGAGTTVADFNNDGMMDFANTGWHDETGDSNSTVVYINKGDLTFEVVTGFGRGSHTGSLVALDYNNDGVMDLFECGRNCNLDGWGGRALLYTNDGTGKNWTMIEEDVNYMTGRAGNVAFGDINNDGCTDLFTSGWPGPVGLFLGDGTATYTDGTEAFPAVAYCRGGDVVFVDINNDGVMELHAYGYRDGGSEGPTIQEKNDKGEVINEYPNPDWPFIQNPTWPNYISYVTGVAANQAPAVPTGFTATQNGSDVVLAWTAPADDTTPSAALRYNVYAKNKATGAVFCLTPADLATGFVRVNRTATLLNTTTYTFKGMNVNEYDFGVQAVDNGFRGGLFASTNADNSVESVKSATVAAYALNGVINIVNGGVEDAAYNVYAVNGAQVAAGTVAAAAQVEVALNAGIYVVEVVAADGVAVVKVVL
ncbi:MAG: VCBS repeat-containing protein [Bacteroidaceae bacterium]|nr:VCBS repeat-containing protein [Bacteroidaceae bacterium]